MLLNRSLRVPVLALAALSVVPMGLAQEKQRSSTQEVPSAPSAPNLQLPPTGGVPANPFPKVDPKNFTAKTPTTETVNEFLRQSWGYDSNRIWQVAAILKTPVEGVSKVVVQVAEKGGEKPQTAVLQFYSMPDGKHIISDDVISFGAHPFAEDRATLVQKAAGPARGATAKDLLIVEFADFQCPHCKTAAATVDKLVQDFPNARFVYENYPLTEIHPEAYKASLYSVCVGKEGGTDAFYKFATALFDGQAGLTPEGAELTIKAAVAKVGLDPVKVTACTTTPAAKAEVDASLQLGKDLNIVETPTLFVNGRRLAGFGNIPYDTLKKIIEFHAKEDGPAAK